MLSWVIYNLLFVGSDSVDALSFVKAQALGNDFIILHAAALSVDLTPNFLSQLAHRRYGIGADQIIVYDHVQIHADVLTAAVWFYNADGSMAEACGNGTRCLVQFLCREFSPPQNGEANTITTVHLQTCAGRLVGKKTSKNEGIAVQMPVPVITLIPPQTLPSWGGEPPFFVTVGNPHLVCFVDDHIRETLPAWGGELENHPYFPNRVNVSFATLISDHEIALMVWERGVGLTPACGSAACATAVAGICAQFCASPVTVQQPGGDLVITWGDKQELWMVGPAQIIYEGVYLQADECGSEGQILHKKKNN